MPYPSRKCYPKDHIFDEEKSHPDYIAGKTAERLNVRKNFLKSGTVALLIGQRKNRMGV